VLKTREILPRELALSERRGALEERNVHRAHALLIQKLRDAKETPSGVSRNSMRCFK